MITGRFNIIDISVVPAGQPIKATIEWFGINDEFSIWQPWDPAWKSFLIAESPGLFRLKLDDTNEMQRDFTRKRTFTLDKMPNREIAITFSIWAHHEAGYDWNWGEYDYYMEYGYATGAAPLAFDYKFISPGITPAPPGPPPEEEGARLSGKIISIEPAKVAYGQPIDLSIYFEAYVETIWEQGRGWDTRLTATINGLSDSDIQNHIGRDGSRTQTLNLGAMPNKSISGTIVLEGRGKNLLSLPTEWKELDRKSISVKVVEVPTPPTPPTPPTKYQCQYCGQYFASQAELEAHIKAAHPIPPIACSIDADCPDGYECVAGKCIKKKGLPDWLVPVAIVGAAILLAPKGKAKQEGE